MKTSFEKRIPFLWRMLTGIALTAFLYSPVTSVMDTQLDSSNSASYTYFAAHHFQYGSEVVPMSGPYGYVMYGSVYNGLLFWTRLIAQLLCAGAFATLILWFFHQCRDSAWRWLWLVLILFLCPIFEDLRFELTILLSGLLLLQRPPKAPAHFVVTLVSSLLAFISLIKGTHLVLSFATLSVVLVHHVWLKNWRRVALVTGSYAAAFLLFWLLAGQNPLNIPAFFAGTRALTNGYNGAMALNEERAIFLHGILALVSLATAFAWGFWHQRKNPSLFTATLLFAGFTFVEWKHGFVRADAHIYIFYSYTAVAAVFWLLYAFTVNGRSDSRPVRVTAVALMVLGVLTGLWAENARLTTSNFRRLATTLALGHLKTNLNQLIHPLNSKLEFDHLLTLQRETYAMPLSKLAVGNHSIDLFGFQHGIIQLNEMNYHPRPMGGGAFNAYNRYLMQLNRAFIRDCARRPDYYFLLFETIDNRLGAQDDGLTLLEILNYYQPLLIERDHLLLKAIEHPAPAEPKFLSRRTFKFSQFVPTPRVGDDELLLARFDIRLNLKGNIRSFFYKEPLMFMTLQGEGINTPESRRVIPSMISSPFLFSPAIENNTDLSNLYTRHPGKQVTGFFIYRLEPGWNEEDMTVEFYSMSRPKPSNPADIEKLLTVTPTRIFNITPESVVADNTRQLSLGALLVQTLHAPGQVTWQLDGSEKELDFDYGFMPEAVARGSSNGAIFIVELHPPDGGPPKELFRKLLDPVRVADDRINQTSRVVLTGIKPGSHLVLRTDPGEYGDTAWDWCYVARVQLKRGYFPSTRFPVFNREPSVVEPADSVALDIGDEKVFMLNVPGLLSFDLKGNEHRVQLEYGFLPGAYSGEGRTEGADFVAELVHAGQAPVEIFRRPLRPVSIAQDRGRFTSEIKLPTIFTGDRLIIRTNPAPGKNNSWGWTYFSRLIID